MNRIDFSQIVPFVNQEEMFSSEKYIKENDFEGAKESTRINAEIRNVFNTISEPEKEYLNFKPQHFPQYQKRYHACRIINAFMDKVFMKLDHRDTVMKPIVPTEIEDLYFEIPGCIRPQHYGDYDTYDEMVAMMFKKLFLLSMRSRFIIPSDSFEEKPIKEAIEKDAYFISRFRVNIKHSDYFRHTRDAELGIMDSKYRSIKAVARYLKKHPDYGLQYNDSVTTENGSDKYSIMKAETDKVIEEIVSQDRTVNINDSLQLQTILILEDIERDILKNYHIDPAFFPFDY